MLSLLFYPAVLYRVPETLILACARKALFRPTQFLALNLLEFGNSARTRIKLQFIKFLF